MITSRKEALERIQQYTALFEVIKDKRCVLSFGSHSFTITPQEIKLATQSELKNIKPDKIMIDGKLKSPFMFTVLTDVGNLFFILDITNVAPLINGLRFDLGYTIDIRVE